MADADRIVQLQRLDQLSKIISVGIHFIAVPGLTRAPVAAMIVSNEAISTFCQK
jgi:uncharacterized protein (UPF0210 family)